MKHLQKFNDEILDSVTLQNLTDTQELYLHDEHRFIYNPSGRRSRKTMLGMRITILRALQEPGIYLCAAPTHSQAKSIFWHKLNKIVKLLDIKAGQENKTDREIYIHSANNEISTLKVVGLDRPSRVEGSEIVGIHATEIPDMNVEMWLEHLRPMLSDEVAGRKIWAILDGTYDSQADWWTDMIQDACDGTQLVPEIGKPVIFENPNNTEVITYIWHSEDVLQPDEIKLIKREYSERLYGQEFGGKPMRDGSRVYYGYTDKNNVDTEFNTGLMTYLSFDFNINPMTCTVWQKDQTSTICVKEFVDYDSNATKFTPLVINWLRSKQFEPNRHQLMITGDHAGHSGNTAVSQSGWNNIENIFIEMNMNYQKYTRRSHAGSLRDGQDTLNSRFAPMTGTPFYYVNKEKAPYLHQDLMKLKYEKNSNNKQNEESGKRGHLSDTARYMAYNFDRVDVNYNRTG